MSGVVAAPAPSFLERVAFLEASGLHAATAAVLRYFVFEHLPTEPVNLREASRPFAELALQVAGRARGAEATVALRKLLEAKDCAVRDQLPPAPAYPLVKGPGA